MVRTEWDENQKKSPEFEKQAVERMREAKDIGLLAQELGVSRRTLYRWKDIQLGRLKPVREPKPREKKLEEEIQRLKQALANRTLEVDFFLRVQRRHGLFHSLFLHSDHLSYGGG